jgi:hypothetical protein
MSRTVRETAIKAILLDFVMLTEQLADQKEIVQQSNFALLNIAAYGL